MPRKALKYTARGAEAGWPSAALAGATRGAEPAYDPVPPAAETETKNLNHESIRWNGHRAVLRSRRMRRTPESESLKEARKLHDQLTRISGDLHEAMQASLVRIEEEIEASMSAGDSTLAIQLARLESQLGELDVRFHDWESTVVGIPGDACNHDHDHAHDHEGHARPWT